MKIGYLTATSRTTGSFRKLGPVMHGMHGLTVFGYVMMPANLVPSNRLNSSTALDSQKPRTKIQTETRKEEIQI